LKVYYWQSVNIIAKDIKLWKVKIPDDCNDKLADSLFKTVITYEIGEY